MESPADATSAPILVLLRLSGDISTKSRRTRLGFLRQLRRNLTDAVVSTGATARLEGGWARLYVETEHPEVVEVLPRVFGIQSLSVAHRRTYGSLDDLVRTGTELFTTEVAGKKFAVRARRGSDRGRISFRSQDIERDLGTALLPHALKVDLDNPEITVRVELDAGQAYFFTEQIPAYGGLPLGAEGVALALVSGGFDSAVAAWLMLKRGVRLEYLFFNLGGEAHERGVLDVMKVLAERWSYGYRPRLHAIDLRPAVERLQARTRPRNWQVLLKRLMLRGAQSVAHRLGCQALVTGEAVGQVSSQTLQNLAVVSQNVTLPILRPLLGFNKDEIVERARRIGTFDQSASVPEYCALDAKPTTHASPDEVTDDENNLEIESIDESFRAPTIYDLRGLSRGEDGPHGEAYGIDSVPARATVIDLRRRHAFDAWHYPGALRLDYLDALSRIDSFDREQTYVICCEVEFKSATLTERMRAAGLAAYQFRDGARGLLRYAIDQNLTAEALVAPALIDG